ncbi:MAG: A/G-specific adenine glycosylase, partial [Natronomonas sp.]
EFEELELDSLGPRVRVDYAPDGEYGREWLRELVGDLESDGLVTTEETDAGLVASLRQ